MPILSSLSPSSSSSSSISITPTFASLSQSSLYLSAIYVCLHRPSPDDQYQDLSVLASALFSVFVYLPPFLVPCASSIYHSHCLLPSPSPGCGLSIAAAAPSLHLRPWPWFSLFVALHLHSSHVVCPGVLAPFLLAGIAGQAHSPSWGWLRSYYVLLWIFVCLFQFMAMDIVRTAYPPTPIISLLIHPYSLKLLPQSTYLRAIV